MKPEERAEIMKTLKELTGKISQLKDELKTSSTTSTTSKLKSKTEVFIAQDTCPSVFCNSPMLSKNAAA